MWRQNMYLLCTKMMYLMVIYRTEKYEIKNCHNFEHLSTFLYKLSIKFYTKSSLRHKFILNCKEFNIYSTQYPTWCQK